MPGKELVPRPAVGPPDVARPPWEQRIRRESSPTAWQWLRRRHHWTLPVFLLPGLFLAGLALHAFHGGKYVLWGWLATLIVAAISAPFKWNRTVERVYAVASITAAGGWLLLAAHVGPLLFGWFGVPWMLVILGAGVITWGGFWWKHHRPRGQRKREKLRGKWDLWWQSHCWHWNLGGSKVAEVWQMGLTTKVRVHGLAGRHSKQHVDQVLHLIESGLDGYADVGLVRCEQVKGHPNWFDFYFKKDNPLRQAVEYDPALAPRSVHDEYAAWLLETGAWKTIPLRCNRFVIGESRSGKSNDLLVGLAALTGCPDGFQVLIDLKGGRSARPVLEAAAVAYVVTELDEARMVLRFFVAEAKARAKHAYTGDEQLHATLEVPAGHLLIDETHGLTSVANGDAECSALLALVSSLGMGLEEYVWVFTQFGSLEESVRTEQTRGNLNVRTVYRVEEARHGAYVIPEYNKLDASKLEEQGTCYIKAGPRATAEQGRAPHMPHKLLKQVASQNAALVTRPSLILYCGTEVAYTAEGGRDVTWQEWWDTRWLRLDPAFHDISPQYQAAAASSPAEAFAAMPEPPEPSPATVPGEGDAKQAAARMQAELDEVHRGLPRDFRPAKVNLGPVIARQKDAFATALESAPPGGISPTQLKEESGLSERWVYQQLRVLVDLGSVTQIGRGRYAPVADANIRRAMDEIRENGDRLHREAKRMVNAA